jgi:hypothetical protein
MTAAKPTGGVHEGRRGESYVVLVGNDGSSYAFEPPRAPPTVKISRSRSTQPSGPHIIVIVTYIQDRKGYALCRTRDLPGAWQATWKPFRALRVITHFTYCIVSGLLYGTH